MTDPNIILTNVTNISVDGTTQNITGLRSGTRYNLRGVLTHTGTGKMVLLDRLKDTQDNEIDFTTDSTETVSFVSSTPVSHFNQISTNVTFSTNTSAGYDLEFKLYRLVTGSYVYQYSKNQFNVVDGDNLPMVFDSLRVNTMFKVTVTIKNRRTQLFYNGGAEFEVFTGVSTLDYLVTISLDGARTTRTATTCSVYVNSLGDNSGDNPGNFDNISFYATTPGQTDAIVPLKTNVAFISAGGSALHVDYSGLLSNTTYTLSGIFTRNSLYSKVVSFGSITTEAYVVTYQITGLVLNTTSIQFSFTQLAPNALHDNSGNNDPIDVRFDAYLPSDLTTPVALSPYEYQGTPYLSTRTFNINGLTPDTAYVVKVRFSKVGHYTNLESTVLSESTISNILNADLTIQDVAPGYTNVSFGITDFQSEYPDNLHTVQIIAIRYTQQIMLDQGLVAYWLFSEYDLKDAIGQELLPAGDYYYDNPYIQTNEAYMVFQWFPSDNTVFYELQGDFRLAFDMEIPDVIQNQKLDIRIANYAFHDGIQITVTSTTITFRGKTDGSNGDTTDTLFEAVYTIPGGFFGVRHLFEFTYLNFPLDTLTKNFGIGKIFVDGVEVAFDYANNSANEFGTTTINRGLYFITINDPAESNWWRFETSAIGTKIHALKIGSQTGTLY